MPSSYLSRNATAISPSPPTHSGPRPLQRFILPSTAPQQTRTPPHLHRVPHQQNRANTQPQTGHDNNLPWQILSSIPPWTRRDHNIFPRQLRARVVPRQNPTSVFVTEEIPWLSVDQVLVWSDGSELDDILPQYDFSSEVEVEVRTNNIDVTQYSCTPAAEFALEFLPAVLAPDAEMENCAICMDEMCPQDGDDQIAKLPCGHLFHRNCIMKWLCNHNTCPMCRFQLPKDR